MTPEQIIDDLVYASCAFNRIHSPRISDAQWAKIFANAEALEARYEQQYLAGERADGEAELRQVESWDDQTEAERREWDEWLDEVYEAYEAERGMQEEEELRNDH